ncbi:hypothetical protein, partial [Klebsiella pneumoniae]|uniref:hypothetical protein n=1 Tax=Klebsiella pneumoniae TaxID=573 RepID=UPI0025A08531
FPVSVFFLDFEKAFGILKDFVHEILGSHGEGFHEVVVSVVAAPGVYVGQGFRDEFSSDLEGFGEAEAFFQIPWASLFLTDGSAEEFF